MLANAWHFRSLIGSTLVAFLALDPAAGASTAAGARAAGSTALLSAATWSEAVSPQSALTQPCADVVVLEANGADTAPASAVLLAALEPALDESLTVRHVTAEAALPSAADMLQVVESAHATDDIINGSTEFATIAAAAEQFSTVIDDSIQRCSGEVHVAIGNGSGALALQQALVHSEAIDRTSAVLFGNPARDARAGAHEPRVRLGDALDGQGLVPFAAELGLTDDTAALPPDLLEHTVDVCVNADPLCDTGEGLPPLSFVTLESATWAQTLAESLERHASYGQAAPFGVVEVTSVGTQVAERVNGLVVGSRQELAFSASIADAGGVMLGDVPGAPQLGSGSQWRISPLDTEAPNALSLTASGSLVVLDAAPGEHRWTLEVRSAQGPWVPLDVIVSVQEPASSGNARGATPPFPPAMSDLAHRQECADILFVGIRGSGQPETQAGGYGSQVSVARDGFMNSLPEGVTVRELALDYEALSVPNLAVPDFQFSSAFLASVDSGVEELVRVLLDSYLHCDDERWVISGYSQGAWVAHMALSSLGAVAPERLGAVILVANPGRALFDDVPLRGTATVPGAGIGAMFATVTPTREWMRDRTIHFCDFGDLVCDTTNTLARANALTEAALQAGGLTEADVRTIMSASLATALSEGMSTHTRYATNYTRLAQLGVDGAAILERTTGLAGVSYLDSTRFITGTEYRTASFTHAPEIITNPDGSQVSFWVEREYTSSWWGSHYRLMTSERAGLGEAWTVPTVAVDIGHRLRLGDFHAETTTQGKVVVMWSETVEQGWITWGSSKWGDTTLRMMVREPGETEFSEPTTVRYSMYRDLGRFSLHEGRGGHLLIVINSEDARPGYSSNPDGSPTGEAVEAAYMDPEVSGWSEFATLEVGVGRIHAVTAEVAPDGRAVVAWHTADLTVTTTNGFEMLGTRFRELPAGATTWAPVEMVPLPVDVMNAVDSVYSPSMSLSGMTSAHPLAIGGDGALHVAVTARHRWGGETLYHFTREPGGEWIELKASYSPSGHSSAAVVTRPSGQVVRIVTERYGSTTNPEHRTWMTAETWNAEIQRWSTPRSIGTYPIDTPGIKESHGTVHLLDDGTIAVDFRPASTGEGMATRAWTMLPPGASRWSEPVLLQNYSAADAATRGLSLFAVNGVPASWTGVLQYSGVDTIQYRTVDTGFALDERPKRATEVTVERTSTGPLRPGDSVALVVSSHFTSDLGSSVAHAPGTIEIRDGDTVLGAVEMGTTPQGLSVTLPRGGDVELRAVLIPLDADEVASSTSTPLVLSVTRATTTTEVRLSTSSSPWDEGIDIEVDVLGESVDGGTASVRIVHADDIEQTVFESSSAAVVDGRASIDVPASTVAAPGEYLVSAVFSGNATHAPSVSEWVSLTIERAARPVIAAGPAIVLLGSAAEFEFDVAPDATGTITLSGATTSSELPLVDGEAAWDTSSLEAGEWSFDVSYSGDVLYESATTSFTVTVVEAPQAERLAGANRFETSVRVAREWAPFEPGTGAVYIANGLDFPDALSAAPAAGFGDSPLLLTERDALPAVVANELLRLGPAEVMIVGGSAVVTNNVVTRIRQLLPSATVIRLAGNDRYETSRAITRAIFEGSGSSAAFIATGAGFPDALSASAAAGLLDAPVILLPGTGSAIDRATSRLLQDLGVRDVYISGGTSVVSVGIERALADVPGVESVTRLAGVDRYSTSTAVNSRMFDSSQRAFLAVGTGFADALSGAALAGGQGAPLYVVPSACVPRSVLENLASLGVVEVVLLGGQAVLSTAVERLRACP